MADAMFTLDCREQFQLLRQHRTSEPMLAPMLEGMCNTLAMGVEEYIRGFDAKAGIELLADIGTKNIITNGDAATMCLRSLGLILENVPRAIDVGFAVPSLVTLVRTKLAGMNTFLYEAHTPGSLCEDCLRVVSFLCEADTTGTLLQSGLLTEVASAMQTVESSHVSRCLAAITALLDKLLLSPNPRGVGMNLPPARDRLPQAVAPTPPTATSPAKDKKEKKASATATTKPSKSTPAPAGAPPAPAPSVLQPLPPPKAASVRRELETRVIPTIQAVLIRSVARNATSDGQQASDRDAWPMVESALECLETLLYRIGASAHFAVANAHPASEASYLLSPWITPLEVADELVDAIMRQDFVTAILNCLLGIANNEKRRLVVLSVLTTFARFKRAALRIPLLEQPIVEFFTDLLAPSKRDLSSLLANAFPKRVQVVNSAQSPSTSPTVSNTTSSSLITTAAAQLLQTVFPPLPNSLVRVHFRVMPVHSWQWADDMHTFTDYNDESCLLLETARLTMQPTVAIKVRNVLYRADISAMRQLNVASGVARPIKRSFVPRSFTFVDWGARINHMLSAGPGGEVSAPFVDEPLSSPPISTSAAADEVLTLLTSYGPMMMAFAQSASSEVLRSLAVSTVTRMLACVATPFPPEGFYRCLESLQEEFLTFIASVLSAADDLVTIDMVLTILHFLFAVAEQDAEMQLSTANYSPNADPTARRGHSVTSFARVCRRYGIAKKLSSLSQRLQSKLGSDGTDFSTPQRTSRITDKPATGTAGALAGCAVLLSRAHDLEALCGMRRDGGMSSETSVTDTTPNTSFMVPQVSESMLQHPASPATANAPVAAAVAHFRELTDADDPKSGKEAFLPELLRVVAESRHLTSHEFAALHLTSALARFFCAPANTPQAEATAKRRLKQLGEELQKRPDAAHVLVSLLISDLGHSAKRLPEAQSIGTRHADKCRAWPDALQRLNALSPNVDLCCNKAAGEAGLARQRTEMRDATEHQNTRHAPPEEMKHRCPQGHLLLRETTRRWYCDICHKNFSTPNSFGCRRCDFDVCASCHQSTYRGVAAGGRSSGPRRF
jgi:hypothetical protein